MEHGCRDIHTFRAVSDNHFIHKETMQRILDGRMAREFKKRDLSMILGEVEAEVREPLGV